MVRRAALLLLVLSLAGCGFFTASLFPGYLAQAEKSYDLGSRIDGFLRTLGSADYRWYSQVFVLTTDAGIDYGAVLIEIDSLPNKRLIMVDPQGSAYDWSTPIPNPSPPPSIGELSRLRLTDNSGRFVVGNLSFDPGALPAFSMMEISNYYALGFSDGTNNYLLWNSDSLTLTYQSFSSGWTSGATYSVPIDVSGGFELRGVYYDPSATTGREVVLVLSDYSYNRVLVVFTPTTDYSGGSLATVLSYPYLQFTDVDAGNVIYTRKGIVLADYDGNAALMDFSGNETGKKLDLGQRGEVRLALDIEGDHFYVFNPEDQMLYRGNTGW